MEKPTEIQGFCYSTLGTKGLSTLENNSGDVPNLLKNLQITWRVIFLLLEWQKSLILLAHFKMTKKIESCAHFKEDFNILTHSI